MAPTDDKWFLEYYKKSWYQYSRINGAELLI